jgi:hypothetical protein
VELVVFGTDVHADHGPHSMIVLCTAEAGWPLDAFHRELGTREEGERARWTVGKRSVERRALAHVAFEDFGDGGDMIGLPLNRHAFID